MADRFGHQAHTVPLSKRDDPFAPIPDFPAHPFGLPWPAQHWANAACRDEIKTKGALK